MKFCLVHPFQSRRIDALLHHWQAFIELAYSDIRVTQVDQADAILGFSHIGFGLGNGLEVISRLFGDRVEQTLLFRSVGADAQNARLISSFQHFLRLRWKARGIRQLGHFHIGVRLGNQSHRKFKPIEIEVESL